VILLHGGFGHSGNWGFQVLALVRNGYHVILLDSRGHGRSTRDSRPFTYELMASDVLAVIDALLVEKAGLVGWSDGACTGLILAAKVPARAAGVFFFGCNMDPSGVKQITEPNPILDRCLARLRPRRSLGSNAPNSSPALSARDRLAACLRTIARLLRVGWGNNGFQNRSSEPEQLELEIASRLSEANSYEEQAAFEELIHGSIAVEGPKLGDAIAATEEVYVCSLPWIREQRSGQTMQEAAEPQSIPEFAERLPNAMEVCADRIGQHQRRIADEDQTPIDYLIQKTDSGAGKSADRLEELCSAVLELQVLVSAQERQTNEN
jgi:pimeloyl-ACP methyl ester carboxylesterase